MPNDDDDVFVVLLGAGVLALIGYGVYRVLKSVGQYEAGETVTSNQVASLSPSTYSSYSSNDDDDDEYYPDYEGDDLEDAENEDDDDD